jgi:hypothetical protein
MKGQASLEYLLLCVIALSMLALSFSALIGIREAAGRGASAIGFSKSASVIGTAASEVCALGSGNGREMRIDAPLNSESEKADEGWIVRFTPSDGQNISLLRPCHCEVDTLEGVSGLVYMKNENGKIRIRGR